MRLREKALGGDGRALDRMIALALAHNNEEPAAAGSLSAADASILQIYNSRVLNGAVAMDDTTDVREGSIAGSSSIKSNNLDEANEPTATKTVRLTKRMRSNDEHKAVNKQRSNYDES